MIDLLSANYLLLFLLLLDLILTISCRKHTYEIGGIVRIEESFIPPSVREIILQGLKTKRLTWEFLTEHGTLFREMTTAHAPVQYMIDLVTQMVKEDVKKNPIARLQIYIEHFWRVRATVGGSCYDPEVLTTLLKLKLSLPLGIEGKHSEEMFDHSHERKVESSFQFYRFTVLNGADSSRMVYLLQLSSLDAPKRNRRG